MVQVIERRKAFLDFCEHTLDMWKRHFPEEVGQYLSQMGVLAQGGADADYWTEGQHFKHIGEIPERIYKHLNLAFPGWIGERDYRDAFLKRYAAFRADRFHFEGTQNTSRAQGLEK